MKKLYEENLGNEELLSYRKLSENLSNDGYPVSYTLVRRMVECVDYLLPAIPDLLYAGLGRPRVEELIIFKNQLQKYGNTI